MQLAKNLVFNCRNAHQSLEQSISQHQFQKKLGLNQFNRTTRSNVFVPCPISLTPWELTKNQFSDAVHSAKSLSRLLESLSNNRTKLIKLLADYNDESSLLYQLKQILTKRLLFSENKAKGLNLNRYDFLLNNNNEWKLVESNAIAAGMGPFAEKLGQLYQSTFDNKQQVIADNPSIKTQAKAMFDAAQKLNGRTTPTVVFVVDADEDNIHDQAFLSDEVERLGATVIYRTFKQLDQELCSNDDSLYIAAIGKIDLFYFRTGYNEQDYLSSIKNLEPDFSFIQLREWVEKHQVVVSPSIEQQVASSKWVQMKLSLMSPEDLKSEFGLSTNDAIIASKALGTRYKSIENIWQVKRDLQSDNWLLKSQEEGGGNVIVNGDKLPSIDTLKTSYLLMEKISNNPRKDVMKFSNEVITSVTQVTSELGIFALGEEHEYGGFLLRSKQSDSAEVGVHSGNGFLDLVAFPDG